MRDAFICSKPWTYHDIDQVSMDVGDAEVREEGRALWDERPDGAERLRALLAALVVDARVREHVVDPQELRVRAGRGAQKLQEPTIELALRVKL